MGQASSLPFFGKNKISVTLQPNEIIKICNSSTKWQRRRNSWWHRRLACAVNKLFLSHRRDAGATDAGATDAAATDADATDGRVSKLFLVLIASFG